MALTGYHDRQHEKLTVRIANEGSYVEDPGGRVISVVIEGDGLIYVGLSYPAAAKLAAKLCKLLSERV